MTPRLRTVAAGLALAAMLAACAGDGPPTPDWKIDASGAADRFVDAWLVGDARIEQTEFERARREIASTGRADLVARIELLRCATRASSLVFEPCTGFETLRADVQPGPETAYADYLAGQPLEQRQIDWLPRAQQEAARLGSTGTNAAALAFALRSIADPLSRLVAAGVLFRNGRGSGDLVQVAIDTASERGWRRPLLAWLGVKARQAELTGDSATAVQARRRMDLVAPTR